MAIPRGQSTFFLIFSIGNQCFTRIQSTKKMDESSNNQPKNGFKTLSKSLVWVFFLIAVRYFATVFSRRSRMSAASFRRNEKKESKQMSSSVSFNSGWVVFNFAKASGYVALNSSRMRPILLLRRSLKMAWTLSCKASISALVSIFCLKTSPNPICNASVSSMQR